MPLAPLLPLSNLSDNDLRSKLKEHSISLTIEEARKIIGFLGRDPTLTEAIVWGIQGSEHCSYKSSKTFLQTLPINNSKVILGPKEDSGIVAITDGPEGKRWGLAIAHESHNSPSQIVPFEGAATGIGGVVRDVVCMGARVIGCMDLLRFGDLKSEETRVIASEVCRGIAGYGNPLGIPNLGGDTVFDSSYNGHCLVNAVAIGIVREDEIIHSYAPSHAGKEKFDIIIVGKPTDRSGFGGASFASADLEEDKKEQNSGAVQEPNPFLERHLLASTYNLFDWLKIEGRLGDVSFKDLGAGGVVCASVEQIADQGFGAEIDLGLVHTALEGLPAEIIACAETQERFCWTCHPDLTEHLLKHYNETWDLPSIAEGARASRVGHVTEDGVYRLSYEDQTVIEAKALDITCGFLEERPQEASTKSLEEPKLHLEELEICLEGSKGKYHCTVQEACDALLEHSNALSKESIFLHYDKTVQGNTILEPGEADAGVSAPLQDLKSTAMGRHHADWDLSEEDRWRGVAVAGDGTGRYGRISPYLQGYQAVMESIRNVIAVGATPRALTDCLNYGNPEVPAQCHELAEGIRGIGDAARGVQVDGECVAIISGNVSLYNSAPDGSAIDPTAIVCCVGILPDARKAVSMQLKSTDSTLLHMGAMEESLGGSLYYQVLEEHFGLSEDTLLGSNVPNHSTEELSRISSTLPNLIDQGLILASHDISQGGLFLALLEMTASQRGLGGKIGLEVDLSKLGVDLRLDAMLFTEQAGFILEVENSNVDTVMEAASKNGIPISSIGTTSSNPKMSITHASDQVYQRDLKSIHKMWRKTVI